MSKVDSRVYHLNAFTEACLTQQNKAFCSFEYEYILSLINKHEIKSVLDIGTGEGSFISGLAAQSHNVQYHAIDAGSDLINIANAKNQLPNILFENCLFDQDFYSKQYDLITARFSVEHMNDIEVFLAEARKRLIVGGIILITEYYSDNMQSENKHWKLFREKEMEFYAHLGSHASSSLTIPKLLHNHHFKNIQSSFRHIAPSTIGHDDFYDLIDSYINIYGALTPTVWTEELQAEMLEYTQLARNEKSGTTEDIILISQTIGFA